MKVILLEELRGKGGEGDVVEVATGFAVNYLFPRKVAIAATKGNLKQLELRKHNIAKREAARLDTADQVVSALGGKAVIIAAKVGEEGQLFGSVTAANIASALQEQLGLEIDRKHIDLKTPIKTAGEHSVMVGIYRDINAALTVKVVDEKALLAAAEAAAAAAAAEAAAAEAAAAEEATVTGEGEAVAEAEGAEAEATEAEAAEEAASTDEADTADEDTSVTAEEAEAAEETDTAVGEAGAATEE